MLIQGDCLTEMKHIPDGSVDAVITDPPYGIGFKSGGAMVSRFNVLVNDNACFEMSNYWGELCRVTRDGGALYIYCRWDIAHKWAEVVEPDSQIIIPRGRCSMGDLSNYSVEYEVVLFKRKGKHSIDATSLKIPNNSHAPNPPPYKRRIVNLWLDVISNEEWVHSSHPTQKTVRSISKMIQVSTKLGDTVLDPFMGSGTTGVACVNLKRDFIGIEVDEKYFELAKKRIREAAAQPRLGI